jgi:glutathione S-transferase
LTLLSSLGTQGDQFQKKVLTMSLLLYGHPFSSYTQKVLVALFENDIPHTLLSLDPNAPNHEEHAADWVQRWPLRKFPLLVDGDRSVVEASVIIEYLQLVHPGRTRLLPDDRLAALDVRFLDRFFDLHVMTPVQHAVSGALTGDADKSKEALKHARQKLELAYVWLEGQLAADGRTWAAGEEFSLADCGAAPSLFYADWTHPISPSFPAVRAYRARLLARPSFARAVDGGRPFRSYFPLGAPDRD